MTKLVIVIPGIMGSNLNKESFTVWPRIFPTNIGIYEKYLPIGKAELKPAGLVDKVYSKLINRLESEQNLKVVPFDYDWRLNNLDNVERLDSILDIYKGEFEEIHIVAHSMGGILTKLFLNKYHENEYISKIKNIITLGTPWHGSVESYKTLIYGAGMPWEIAPLLITKETSKVVSKGFPSIYQLLPSAEYCKRVKEEHNIGALTFNDQELDHHEIVNDYDIKEYLEKEEHLYSRVFDEYWSLLNERNSNLDHISHHEIIGIGHLTLSAISKNNLGEVSGYFKNGDGTVPVFSAKSDSPIKRFFIKGASHQGLPKNEIVSGIISKVINEEEVPQTDGIILDEEEIKSIGFLGKIIRIACPVKISLLKDGQSIYGLSNDLTVENYDELLTSEYNIMSLGSTVYLLMDEKDETSDIDDEKIIIEAFDEGPTSVSIEEYSGSGSPKTYSFSTFNIKPSITAELNISRNIEEVTLNLKEEGGTVKIEKPLVQVEEIKLPHTEYTINYSEGKDIENKELGKELFVVVGEVSVEITQVENGTYDLSETYVSVNNQIAKIDPGQREVDIHGMLKEGQNFVKVFSVDEIGNVEDAEGLLIYYISNFNPLVNLEFLPHQYTIHASDNKQLFEINSILKLNGESKIDISVNEEDQDIRISQNKVTALLTKPRPDRTYTITYTTPVGVFEEILTIDEDALLSIFDGTGDSRNFQDFLGGINLSNPETIKITKLEGMGAPRTINDKNIKNAKSIFISKENIRMELIKKSDYIVSFHHLIEDIKIGEMDVYNFSFKVLNDSDREIKDLELGGYVKISINEETPLSDDDEVIIKFNRDTNLYEGQFKVSIVEKILDGYWESIPIHSAELLIFKKGTNSVLRSKEIKVRKKDKK